MGGGGGDDMIASVFFVRGVWEGWLGGGGYCARWSTINGGAFWRVYAGVDFELVGAGIPSAH